MSKSTFGLPPSRISDFAYALQRIMDLARSVSSLNCADRTGGHFVLMDGNTGNILLATLVGESPVDKAEIYWTNAHEKARRVRERMISNGHMFSRQSRSPEENQWGGSFVAGDYILSFSGFPEMVDEAMMVVLSISMNLLDSPIDLNDSLFTSNPAIGELFVA